MSTHSASPAAAASIISTICTRRGSTPPTPHLPDPLTLSCGCNDMAVNGDAALKAVKREELRHGLTTSSTKRRISELASVQHRIDDDCACWPACGALKRRRG
jgi:hypothetical protein